MPMRWWGAHGRHPAMNESARVGVRPGEPQSHDHSLFGLLRIKRFPGIGERAFPKVRVEAFGDVGVAHAKISRRKYRKCRSPLNAIPARIAPPTKFKTGFQLALETRCGASVIT